MWNLGAGFDVGLGGLNAWGLGANMSERGYGDVSQAMGVVGMGKKWEEPTARLARAGLILAVRGVLALSLPGVLRTPWTFLCNGMVWLVEGHDGWEALEGNKRHTAVWSW
jgi:hypothetical protein